jgi:hypothetical protein
MKRLAFAAAAVAFIAYCVADAYQFVWAEEDANAAKVIAGLGGVAPDPAAVAARYRYYEQITGPGWQR